MLNSRPASPWEIEFHHMIHDLAGAFLFGVTFLFTMELWWRGNTARPPQMLFAMAVTYTALVALERVAMARKNGNEPWLRTLTEAAQALATGLFAATLGLLLIGFISPTDGLHAIIGRIVMEGLPFSLGVGLADILLGEKEDGAHKKGRQEGKANRGGHAEVGYRILVRAGATAFGATIIALALSATDEIPLLASHVTYPHLLGIVGASLIISYLIVFASNFVATEAREVHGGFDAPLVETVMSYVISLIMAAGMLWLYQLLHIGDPLNQWVSDTIVLGLPASIGGAAGRLAA